MTNAAIKNVLHESISEVLEKMFFLCPMGESTDPTSAGVPTIAASLKFEGEPSGCLSVSLPLAAARPIAADFLCEEADAVSEERIGEVVCELANMICGSILSRLESNTAFRLATPRILVAAETVVSAPAAIRHAVELDNGILTVVVNTERHACSPLVESVF